MKTTILIFCTMLLIQCTNQKIGHKLIINSNQYDKILKSQYLNDTIKTDKFNVPLDSEQYYIPSKIKSDIGTTNEDNSYKYTYEFYSPYSHYLYIMHEPLLYNKIDNKIIFRFTMIRSFQDPITVRLEQEDNKYTLIWKKIDFENNLDPSGMLNKPIKLSLINQEPISDEEWRQFIETFNKSGFWNMENDNNEVGIDGYHWLLEVSTDKYYHWVSRFSPDSGGFYDCCNYLLSLTDLKFDNNYRKY